TTAPPPAHYGAVEGALASGFATAELHHLWGHDQRGLAFDSKKRACLGQARSGERSAAGLRHPRSSPLIIASKRPANNDAEAPRTPLGLRPLQI
ncbi:hypothetical protein CN071_30290, partial [Sinorhizobium meliloti]